MKKVLLLAILMTGYPLLQSQDVCFSRNDYESTPGGLVSIKGKAMFTNFPDVGRLAATSETLIFQKVGCESCFIGARVDAEGNYQILVGEGKYKLIVRNPSSPEVDWLAPDQDRFVDTKTDDPRFSGVINFDVKIQLPK